MLKNILIFGCFFVEAVILWQYTAMLFTAKNDAKKKILTLCVFYTFLFLLSLCNNAFLNLIAFTLVNAIFLFTQCRLTVLQAFFHSVILTSIMGLSEFAVYGITIRFSPDFYTNASEPLGIIFFTSFSKLVFFAIIYIVAHIIKEKKIDQNHPNKSSRFLLIIPVASVFIMFTFLAIITTFSFVPPLDFLIPVSAVFLLIINLLVFGINQYDQKKSAEFTELQLLLQKETDTLKYYEMQLSESENQSILIHDTKKHLQSIALLNERKEYDKVDAYIHQLMDSSALKETVKICDNEMLNAILCKYQRLCSEKQIKIHTDIRSGVLKHVSHKDLTALFCNLLDNAVEAAEDTLESFIDIAIHQKENTPFIVIIVINSCRENPVFNPDGIPISAKNEKNKHGFGIKSIQNVIKQYDGNLQMYYDEGTGTFHTIITLK